MSSDTLIILKGTSRTVDSVPGQTVLTRDDLGLKTGAFLRHVLRYQHAEVWVPRLETNTRPFFSAVLLRLLSRGECWIVDDQGSRLRITIRTFGRSLLDFVGGAIRQYELERNTVREIARLLAICSSTSRDTLDLNGVPVYLRSDILFNLRAGGSVGHTAGVLNNLQRITGHAPVFITTDPIPTARPDIEIHLTDLPGSLWNFPEVLPLAHNNIFPAQGHALLKDRRPAFIRSE